MNSDSGIVNTHSGEWQKVFTFKQNRCSRSSRITVHVRPEWVFTLLQNMHLYAAVEHDRNRTLKAMRKGLALPDDLKATDSLWKKLGDVMFRRYKGGRA